MIISKIIKPLLALIVPNQCLICQRHESLDDLPFCLSCNKNLPLLQKDSDNRAAILGKVNMNYEQVRTHSLLFYYKEGMSQTVLRQIKYYNKRHLAQHMGQMIAKKYIEHITADDILIPVPLHPAKENERGYNQSLLIAQGIAQVTQSAINSKVLIRRINNSSQTQKTVKERSAVMVKTYALRNERTRLDPSKKYIIVDDVITTGATLSACIGLLHRAGAEQVTAVSVAVAV